MNWFTIVKDVADRKKCDVCHSRGITPSAASKGVKTCGTCLRRSGKSRNETKLPKGFNQEKVK
jgi:hypothetical protein